MAVKPWSVFWIRKANEKLLGYIQDLTRHSFPVRLGHLGGNESVRGDLSHMCSRKTLLHHL